MFSSISIENFQAFAGVSEVPLAPITLIFGQNASGKSSFSRAIRLLKQSIDSSSGIENGFTYSGNEVNLNGYRSVVYGQITDFREHPTDLSIALRIEASELGKKFHGLDYVTWQLTTGSDVTETGPESFVMNSTRFWFTEDFAKDNAPGIEFSVRLFNNQKLAEISCNTIVLDESGEITNQQVPFSPDVESMISQMDFDAGDALRRQLRPVPIDGPMDFWSSAQLRSVWNEGDDDLVDTDTDDYEPNGWDEIFHDFAQLKRNFIGIKSPRPPINEETVYRRNFLAEVFHQVRLAITANLSNMSYVGPIRAIPNLVETGGVNQKSGSSNSSRWLKLLTNSRYEIKKAPVEIEEHVHQIWVNLVKDNFTGVWNSFEDVGTGISQVYPVLDAAMPSKPPRWGLSRSEVIVIEQPELHLHPSAQSILGDMFAECVNDPDRNVQFIIETHSENLLLRVQKNIRDGVLDAAKVRVIYVEPVFDPKSKKFFKTVAHELRLDHAGDVLDPFPTSFADLRIQDLL